MRTSGIWIYKNDEEGKYSKYTDMYINSERIHMLSGSALQAKIEKKKSMA